MLSYYRLKLTAIDDALNSYVQNGHMDETGIWPKSTGIGPKGAYGYVQNAQGIWTKGTYIKTNKTPDELKGKTKAPDAPALTVIEGEAKPETLKPNSVNPDSPPASEQAPPDPPPSSKRHQTSATPKKSSSASARMAESAGRIYDLYPRKVARPDALNAVIHAIERVCTDRECTESEAEDYLSERTRKFAKSPAGNRGTYTPYPATWFNKGRYDDDDKEWQKQDGPKVKSNGGAVPAPDDFSQYTKDEKNVYHTDN